MKRLLFRVCVVLALTVAFGLLCVSSHAGRVWWDGSVDDENAPPGKLLSDNEDWWGESILTGVDYSYDVTPDQPADDRADRVGRVGRVLLNGNRGPGVGMKGDQPLVVTFDFKRICTFTEWDICTPSKKVAITLEMRDTADSAWKTVVEESLAQSADQEFHRFPLTGSPSGRFVRMTLQADKDTKLNEIIAWGDSDVSEETPEMFTPVAQGQYPVGVSCETIPGIGKSMVSDRESYYWVRSLKPEHKKQAAVWSRVPTWSGISNVPILPKPDAVNQPIYMTMARNETECAALALKNTLVNGARDVQIKLSDFFTSTGARASGIEAKLGVFGTIGSRNFGNNLGPIFDQDNMLGESLMRKYTLNGPGISDFPNVTLPPSGSAIFWLSVKTDGVKPGVYKAYLQVSGEELIPIKVEVLNVTLPHPFAYVGVYSEGVTKQFPFVYSDRRERDIDYALSCGISGWGMPTPGSEGELARKMAKDRGMKLLHSNGSLIPSIFVHNVYCGIWTKETDFGKEQEDQIAAIVKERVDYAKSLGLDYDDWYGGTGDEPGEGNMEAVATMARMIKKADPKVNLYVNPCYWKGFDKGACASDDIVSKGLKDWYAKYVDLSQPLVMLLQDRPQSFKALSAPRFINSYYYVSAHLGQSESAPEVQLYRKMAWDSFSMGFNGWAFYAYFSPRGSAWNHFDRHPPGEGLQEASDYSIVYPGPRGVIATRQSEALREGYEDWRLLNMLKSKGLNKALQQALRGYKEGKPLEELRLNALRAVADGA